MADQGSLLGIVTQIKTPLALAGLGIAALVGLIQSRRGRVRDLATYLTIGAICLLALTPLVIDGFVQVRGRDVIYRVRVVALDAAKAPIDGAEITTDAANETKRTERGATELAIPRGSLPQDGGVTIYAATKTLKGSARVVLSGDASPTVTIQLAPDQTAGIVGVVSDESGRGLAGVEVRALSGAVTRTDSGGAFRLAGLGAEGQEVRLKLQQDGYAVVDDYYTLGSTPVAIQMMRSARP